MVKRTLQEIADFFDMAAAVDNDGKVFLHTQRPKRSSINWFGTHPAADVFLIERDLVDYTGDWRDSLTLPENWTKEPPFKEGELAYGSDNTGPYIMTSDRMINAAWYRRPTEAEWKVLRGEE